MSELSPDKSSPDRSLSPAASVSASSDGKSSAQTVPNTLDRLRVVGLRATPQRLAIGGLLFEGRDRHVTAEILHDEARESGLKVSLATIYNTLHQFTDAGLLRQVVIDSSRSYFDTNVSKHHHFYLEDENRLADIPGDRVSVLLDGDNPLRAAGPEGTEVIDVDVVVRVRKTR